MYQVIRLLLLLPAAFVVTGSPVSQDKKSITAKQVLRPRILGKDVRPNRGIAAYAKALRKYGAPAHEVAHLSALALRYSHPVYRSQKDDAESPSDSNLSHRGIPSAIGSSRASSAPVQKPQVAGPLLTVPNADDSTYNTLITVGNRSMWMDFDTGSSDFWVFGPDIKGLADNQTLWNQTSTSSLLKGLSWSISYGDGSVASGDVWTDQVILDKVVVPKAVIGVADIASGLYDAPMSGILGLGFDSINGVIPTKQRTLMTQLIEDGIISQPVVSVDLKPSAPGCYTFGDIPWWQYSGNITYSAVNSSLGYWLTQPLGYGIGTGSTINNTAAAQSGIRGVFDTGTTLNLIDVEVCEQYYAKVPSATLDLIVYGGYVFHCNETLPDFELQVGEGSSTHIVNIPGAYINYADVTADLCYGGLQPTFGQIPFTIWGDVLIKNAFMVFDRGAGGRGPPRMGFAKKGAY